MNLKKIITVILLLFSLQSCTKDIDFNQIDEASIHATYLATLIHLNLDVPKFLNEFNKEINFTQDVLQAQIKDDSKPYLEKVEFTVVTENSIDRDFTFQIVFYDETSIPIYTLKPVIVIPANSSEKTTVVEITESDVGVIYDTKYYGFTLTLSQSTDGSVLLPGDTSTLDLKSSVKLFFNYRTQ